LCFSNRPEADLNVKDVSCIMGIISVYAGKDKTMTKKVDQLGLAAQTMLENSVNQA